MGAQSGQTEPGSRQVSEDLVARVWNRIDAMNREDPRRVEFDGRIMAFEERHAILVSSWVRRLEPGASDALLVAARGQHVRRWTISRTSYPRNRAGYLRWREELKRMHAETLAAILEEEGADDDLVARVRALVMKRDIKGDLETQILEDALCLAFLELEFSALRASTDPEKFAQIIRKTWAKMSERGRREALALPLAPQDRAAIEAALQG